MREPKGLGKWGQEHTVRVVLSREYHAIFFKKVIVQGLGTQDLDEALVRRKEVKSEFLASFGQGSTPEPIIKQVARDNPRERSILPGRQR